MQYLIDISYKGTRYHGWQIQQNAHTVQAELNNALQLMFGKTIDTLASGRTDTGVHAAQQFVQFEANTLLDNDSFLHRLNAILPKDIFCKKLYHIPDFFSARYDATERSYEYRISRIKNPFAENLCYFYFVKTLDVPPMQDAAAILLQNTDFQSFSKYHTDVNNYLCTIKEAKWESEEHTLTFHVTANRFLRGMVRALVGTLLEVGIGRLSINDFEKILLEKDRKSAGRAVPPEGLFLTKITYPPGLLIPVGK